MLPRGAGRLARHFRLPFSAGTDNHSWGSSLVRYSSAVYSTESTAAGNLCVQPDALTRKLQSVDKWVVFSDLHVHPKFSPYWQDALSTIHSLAVERSAGVLFLVRLWPTPRSYQQMFQSKVQPSCASHRPGQYGGRERASKTMASVVQGDFWEARTSVQHETLNAVRAALHPWQVPTVAITGNHDQSTASGSEHGMNILEDISSAWTVISEPTLAGTALWLPYRCAAPHLLE